MDAPGSVRRTAHHAHLDRHDPAELAKAVAPFDAEAVVDVSGMNAAAADAALAAFGPEVRLVAISSGDVYRAYEAHGDWTSDAVPLDEVAPLCDRRYVDGPQYENLEMEERYLPRGATVLRLAAVYGEHDCQRRFEFVLRRLRAGRTHIPVGSGTFLFSRVYVGDVAEAVVLALAGNHLGRALNIAERTVAAVRAVRPAGAHGSRGRRRAGPRPGRGATEGISSSPEPLASILLMDSTRARTELGWSEHDPAGSLARSVRWHLDHPPAGGDDDFSAGSEALAA